MKQHSFFISMKVISCISFSFVIISLTTHIVFIAMWNSNNTNAGIVDFKKDEIFHALKSRNNFNAYESDLH